MDNGKQFELDTLNVLNTYGKIDIPYKENNSVSAMQVIKKHNKNDNILFFNACSPYRTYFGNQMKTEFVYCSLKNKIDWRIECKSRARGNENNLIGEITYCLNFVKDIQEDLFCLVLSENLLRPNIMSIINDTIIEKDINTKVWVGTLSQFTTMFKKKIT